MNRRGLLFGVPAAVVAAVIAGPKLYDSVSYNAGRMYTFPEMDFTIDKVAVTAESRILKATWGYELPLEKEITKALELRETLTDQKYMCKDWLIRNVILQREHDKEVYDAIIQGNSQRLLEIGGGLGGPKPKTSDSRA